jgi:hypothetical protein
LALGIAMSIQLVIRAAHVSGRVSALASPGIYLDAVPVTSKVPATTGNTFTRRWRRDRICELWCYLPDGAERAEPIAVVRLRWDQFRRFGDVQIVAVHGWHGRCVVASERGVIWPLASRTGAHPSLDAFIASTAP